MKLADRINAWWRARRRRQAWQRLTPERQLALWMQTIAENPALRDQFRKALRVKAADATGEYREMLRQQSRG